MVPALVEVAPAALEQLPLSSSAAAADSPRSSHTPGSRLDGHVCLTQRQRVRFSIGCTPISSRRRRHVSVHACGAGKGCVLVVATCGQLANATITRSLIAGPDPVGAEAAGAAAGTLPFKVGDETPRAAHAIGTHCAKTSNRRPLSASTMDECCVRNECSQRCRKVSNVAQPISREVALNGVRERLTSRPERHSCSLCTQLNVHSSASPGGCRTSASFHSPPWYTTSAAPVSYRRKPIAPLSASSAAHSASNAHSGLAKAASR